MYFLFPYLLYKFNACSFDDALPYLTKSDDASVAASALCVSRSVDIVQLFHHIRGASHAGINDAAGCERIFFTHRDHPLDKGAKFFRFGDGGRDALLGHERARKASQKGDSLPLLASQCSAFAMMLHTRVYLSLRSVRPMLESARLISCKPF